MLPPSNLSPFEPQAAPEELKDRVAELEARNLYLQTLVVELLDKNEQLRRKAARENPEPRPGLSSSPRN